jgi:hypothetical protein
MGVTAFSRQLWLQMWALFPQNYNFSEMRLMNLLRRTRAPQPPAQQSIRNDLCTPQTVHGILRLIAFVLLCIGVQITSNGVGAISKTVH